MNCQMYKDACVLLKAQFLANNMLIMKKAQENIGQIPSPVTKNSMKPDLQCSLRVLFYNAIFKKENYFNFAK